MATARKSIALLFALACLSGVFAVAAPAATICVGDAPSCGTPDYPMTEAGLQGALDEAAGSSPGADVIEIGNGDLDISTNGVSSSPPAGETVSIIGQGSASTRIVSHTNIGFDPFTLNFMNVPTSTIAQMTIANTGVLGGFPSIALVLHNGGTLQNVVFEVNGDAGALYTAGAHFRSSVGGAGPTCNNCQFRIEGGPSEGLRVELASGHQSTINDSTFERSNGSTATMVGIRNLNGNTTTNVNRSGFFELDTGTHTYSGTVNVFDSFFSLIFRSNATAMLVDYTPTNGTRTLYGSIDGSTIIGFGSNQVGLAASGFTTNAAGDHPNLTARNTLFRLTGSSPTDVNCVAGSNTYPVIDLQNSYIKSTAPTQSGSCSVNLANNVDSLTTPPQFENEGIGDYTPAFGSPLVDAGDPTTSQSGRPLDIYGETRFINGMNGQSGGTIDIGAVENQGPPPDTEPPAITISAPANGSTTSAPNVIVNYTVTDNYGGTPSCNFPSGSSRPLNLGVNTITVSCSDEVPNVGTASVTITREDVTPPVITITAPTNGFSTTDTTVVVSFTATDNSGATPTCDRSSGSSQALAVGINTISVTCQDGANNQSTASVDVTRVDNLPPDVSITSPTNGSITSQPTATLTFGATDNSGATPTCNQTSGSTIPLALGSNTIIVSCQDPSGNVGTGQVTVTRIDVTPPDVTITSPANNFVTEDASVPVTYTATDNSGATPSCNPASGANRPLSFGLNTLSVTCTDAANNSGTAQVNVTRVSDAAPVVTITAPTNGSTTYDPSVVLEYQALDVLGNPADCDIADGSTIPLSVGSNTITVTCTDQSDNIGAGSVTVTRLDNQNPVVTITAPTNGQSISGASTILNFTATDNSGETPSCDKVNGSSQPLAIGSNTITVTCTDSSSNSGFASVTVNRQDVTAPVITITNPANGSTTTSGFVTLNYTAVDDSGQAPTCDKANGSSQPLAFGNNSISVTCQDAASNSNTATVSVFREDNTPPVVTITAPTNGTVTAANEIIVTYTATDDAGATPTCDWVSGDPKPLNFGPNTLTVSCEDDSNNVGTGSVSVTRPDTEAPVISISSPTNGSTTTAGSTTLFYTATDNSGSAPSCDKAIGSTQALAFGLNTISVTCQDASNNQSTESVTITRLDVTPPVITITSPVHESQTSDASTTLVFTAVDDSGQTPICNQTSGSTIPLAFGINDIYVTCEDGSGNEDTEMVGVERIDVAPPVVTITAPTNGLNTNDPSVVLNYTVTDNSGQTPTCNYTDGQTVPLNFGPNTITVSCTDGSSNTGTASVSVDRFDGSPPVITITAPSNGSSTTNSTIAVDYTVTDNSGSAPSCNFASGSSRPLSFGSNTITVSCTDASNNTGTASVNVTRLDNTPPVITITAPSNGSSTTSASTTFSFTATDDAGGTPTCDRTSGASVALAFGSNTITVNCSDGSSNSASASVTVTRLDNTAPVVTITSPSSGTETTASSIAVSYTVTDNSGQTPSCNIASGSSVALNFGPNTITVSCTDGSSNTGSDSVNIVRTDTAPPVVTITSPADGFSTTATSVAVSYTATDNSGAAPTCNFASGSSRPLDIGANTITVSCTDASNNTGSASISVTRIDNQPPTVTINSPVNNLETSASFVMLIFTATDNSGLTPTCDKTSGTNQSLVFGDNTITVECHDDENNTTTASVTVKRLDVTAPVVTITSPSPGASTSNASIPVVFTATDNTGQTPTCDITSGDSVPLAIGSNTVTVSCTDASSNTGTASVTVTRNDVTGPVVTITAPTNASSTTASSTVLTFTAVDDSGQTPICNRISGSSMPLSFGSNTITVSCTDGLGNPGSASVTVTRLDDVDPVVTITSPADGSSTIETSLPVDYTATDNSGQTPTCDVASGATWSLSMGSNTYTVTCQDSSGNEGTDSVTVTRTNDPPPVVTITSPANGSTTGLASIPVTYTATDNSGLTPTCDPASGSSVALSLGSNTITVSCTDDQGGTTIQSVTVTRADTTKPVIDIISPVNGSTVSTSSVVVTYNATDDSGETPTCTPASGSTRNLFAGPNTVTVTCTDGAGNSQSKTLTVTYDPSAPPPSGGGGTPPTTPPPSTPAVTYVRSGTPKFKSSGTSFSLGAVDGTTLVTAQVQGAPTVKLTLVMLKGGFKKGRKCVAKKPKGKAKKCNLAIKGSQTLPMTAGNWKFAWGGMFAGKKLKPGSYMLTSTVSQTGAKTSFKITLTK